MKTYKQNIKEYQEMIVAIDTFKKRHKRYPNYYTQPNNQFKVLKQEYQDAIRRYNAFVKKNKRKPKYITIQGQYLPLKPKYITNGIIGLISAKTHTNTNDYKTLYNAFQKAKYDYYYNDKYPQSTAIKYLTTGLNCTDMNQIAYAALRQMGYATQIVRGTVKCSGTRYGHVWCRIKINNKWVNYDTTAIAKHGTGIGTLICNNEDYEITNINPTWATTDDGKT